MLKIANGSMNVELVVDKSGRVWPIDIGPRAGGNMIPDLLGISLVWMLHRCRWKRRWAEKFVNAPMSQRAVMLPAISIVQRMEFIKVSRLHRNWNSIFTGSVFIKKEGDKIEFFDNAAKCLGIIFMKFPDEKQMFDMMNRMDELVYIDLLEKD